jgi:hypothetical protein
MKIRDLFIIILKVIGLFFVKDLFISLINSILLVISVYFLPSYVGFEGSFLSPLAFIIYLLLAYLLIFKTDWIISKLRLDKGFSNDEININIHRSVILSIALIILGGIIILDEFPLLIEHLYTKHQIKDSTTVSQSHFTAPIVYDICKLIVGFILIYYHRTIVNFIEYKRKK